MRRLLALAALLVLAVPPAAHGALPVVRVSAEPQAPRFGDTLTYTVDVAVPRGHAGSTRVTTDVGVLTRVAAPQTTQSVEGDVAHVVVTERLACLVARCVARAGERVVGIPPARVSVGGVELRGAKVSLRVGPRVPLAVVRAPEAAFRWPSGVAALTARVDPATLQAALAAAGCVFLIVGFLVLARPLFGRERHAAAGRDDPLLRAIRLLRDSTTRDASDRRRAASHAGRLVGETPVAIDAARVAWSRRDPRPADVTALADRVEQAGGSRE